MSLKIIDLPDRVLCLIFFEFINLPQRWQLLCELRLVCRHFSSIICENLPTLDVSGKEVLHTTAQDEDDFMESLFLATVAKMPHFPALTCIMMEYADLTRSRDIPIMRKMPRRGMSPIEGEEEVEKRAEGEGKEVGKRGKGDKDEDDSIVSKSDTADTTAVATEVASDPHSDANRDLMKTPPAPFPQHHQNYAEDRKHGIATTGHSSLYPTLSKKLPLLSTYTAQSSSRGNDGEEDSADDYESIIAAAVSPIKHKLQHILCLSLHAAYIGDIDVRCIAQSCSALLILDISKTKEEDMHMITDAGVRDLGRFLPDLVNVNLSYTYITDASVTALCSGCHQLQKLWIEGCHLLTDEALGYNGIGQSRTLRNLNISHNANFSNQGLYTLAAMYKKAIYPELPLQAHTSDILSSRKWHSQTLINPNVRVPLRSLIAMDLDVDKVTINAILALLKVHHMHLCIIFSSQDTNIEYAYSNEQILTLIQSAEQQKRHILLKRKDYMDYLDHLYRPRIPFRVGSGAFGSVMGGTGDGNRYSLTENRYEFFYNKDALLAMMKKRSHRDCFIVMNHGCMFIHQPS